MSEHKVLSHDDMKAFAWILEDKERDGVLNAKEKIMLNILWNAEQFLTRAEQADALTAEVARLREALKEIVSLCGNHGSAPVDELAISRIAIAALDATA